MATKLFFLKERKKPKDGTYEELAAVKAAAWAWYQHGSGTEGKAVCEFDATRTRRATRPSRYMLEAMKMDKEVKEGPHIHTKKSLLDAYEIESISRQLDNLMESKHNKLLDNGNNPADASLDNGSRRMKKKKKIRKWFWLRHGAICGTREDVINSSASALRDGRRH